MLVIHWTPQKNTKHILKNGISTSKHWGFKGIWCYPFIGNSHMDRNWNRILKKGKRSNFNGLIFKICSKDFPFHVGPWNWDYERIEDPSEFDQKTNWMKRTSDDQDSEYIVDNRFFSSDTEIIIPKRIAPKRIIKIIKDRPTRNRR